MASDVAYDPMAYIIQTTGSDKVCNTVNSGSNDPSVFLADWKTLKPNANEAWVGPC